MPITESPPFLAAPRCVISLMVLLGMCMMSRAVFCKTEEGHGGARERQTQHDSRRLRVNQ